MTLIHYKQKVLDELKFNNSPQNWRLYQWINNPEIKLNRLLKDMEREGLIKISYGEDRGKVYRYLTPQVERIIE